jgi:hypothetical protein
MIFAILAAITTSFGSPQVGQVHDRLSIIKQAPKKYRPVLESFRFAEFYPLNFTKYCQRRLVVTKYFMIRDGDPDIAKDTAQEKLQHFKVKTVTVNRDSSNPTDRKIMSKFSCDMLDALDGLTGEGTWNPSRGNLDFIAKDLGYGYSSRVCAGCYVRLLIDPQNDKQTIIGWTYTIR